MDAAETPEFPGSGCCGSGGACTAATAAATTVDASVLDTGGFVTPAIAIGC